MTHFYKRLSLCITALLTIHFIQSQNLVPNPGFENGTCVVNYNSTPQKIPTTINNWYSCTGASPDPFDVCGTALPAAYAIVAPNVIMGYQYAHTGNRFMGFGFYAAPWYEYIGTKLTEPLEAGETYHVSFWLSCADLMSWAADQVGMYFSTTDISYPSTSTAGGLLNFTPQVVNPAGNFITDTLWQQVSGDFVAAGGEQYIVIGYFKTAVASDFYQFPVTTAGQNPKANPAYKPASGGTGGSPRAYYYIDDVVVQKQSSLPVRLTSFTAKPLDRKVKLDWKTETESNNCRFEAERSDNGLAFHSIGTVPGAINSTSTRYYQLTDPTPVPGRSFYRIKQIDCDGKTSYSNTVPVNFLLSGFSVYPNPVSSRLVVDRNMAGAAHAAIYDLTGRTLDNQLLNQARETINVSKLLPGTYIIKVMSEKESFSQKFIKN